MTKSTPKPASRANDGKTTTVKGVKRTTAQKAFQLKPVPRPRRLISDRDPRRSRLHGAQAKRPESLQCCGRQVARPSRRWRVRLSGNPIRSVASSLVWCARSSASILSRQTSTMGASTES